MSFFVRRLTQVVREIVGLGALTVVLTAPAHAVDCGPLLKSGQAAVDAVYRQMNHAPMNGPQVHYGCCTISCTTFASKKGITEAWSCAIATLDASLNACYRGDRIEYATSFEAGLATDPETLRKVGKALVEVLGMPSSLSWAKTLGMLLSDRTAAAPTLDPQPRLELRNSTGKELEQLEDATLAAADWLEKSMRFETPPESRMPLTEDNVAIVERLRAAAGVLRQELGLRHLNGYSRDLTPNEILTLKRGQTVPLVPAGGN